MSQAAEQTADVGRPSVDDLLEMYRLMSLISTCDDRARKEIQSGVLQAAFYPVRGLEVVCAALGVLLRPQDRLVSTYRNLGDAIAKGVSVPSIIAEAAGRVTGTCKGKGGPMHVTDVDRGFMLTTGIVGGGIPIANGLALASQLDGSDTVTAVTFGDGATSIGAFHEALGLAAIWKLPIVFVCQNNGWGEHTPVEEYTAEPRLERRAIAHGIPAERVDGFDALATHRALGNAIERARRGEGPTFVECVTYRLAGHSGSSDFSYVPKDRLDAAWARDPAPTLGRWLTAEGHADDGALRAIDDEVGRVVDDAFEFAASSDFPPLAELMTDVFADPSPEVPHVGHSI